MQSAKIDVFFSCSFDDADKEMNDFFLALCRGLDLVPTNVSTGATKTPPEVAKSKIAECQALIAVCSRRDELKNGKFIMPQAVHDEISFAFGKDTPVLMLVEDAVDLKGFKPNFGTYQIFDRHKLWNIDFLEKTVRALHELKLELLGAHHIGVQQGISDARAEYVHHLVELKPLGDDYIWSMSTSKKITYTAPSKRGFSAGVWSIIPPNAPADSAHITWDCKVKNSSRNIELISEVERSAPGCVEVFLKPSPHPEEGDYIEYMTAAAGRYINAVWDDEVSNTSKVHLEAGDFKCAEGLAFQHRTKSAIIEFRFTSEYGISKRDVVPFVASYTSSIDYEVKSEIDRAKVRVEDFGGNLVVRLEVDSPLPGHMYGVAWNPKIRPGPPALE